MNTRCQFPPASAHSDPVHAGSLLFPALDSQHKFGPSWRSLPSQRYNLLAKPFLGRAPAVLMFPTAIPALGFGDKPTGSAPPSSQFPGVLALSIPAAMDSSPGGMGCPKMPCSDFLTPADFPTRHHCGFKPFLCCETAPGGSIPSGRARNPRNGECRQGLWCRKQQRDPQTGIVPEPHGQPETGFLGRAFAMPSVAPQVPIPLLQNGEHQGDTEPPDPLCVPNPVTGGAVPHCH